MLEIYGVRILAWGIGICSALLTGIFTSSFGGDNTALMIICFAVGVFLSAMCPVTFNFTARAAVDGKWVLFALLLVFAVLFACNDVVTNGGTSAMFRQSEMTLADNQNDKAKNARSQVVQLEKRISEIRQTTAWKGEWQSPKAYDDLIEAAQLIRDNEARRGGCGPICEEKTKELANLTAAKANALHRHALKQEMIALERDLKEAKVASAETPTRASAALTHATNLAAGLSGQINPDGKEKFWANYKLSALFGLTVTLASIAASILYGVVVGTAKREHHERYVTNRILADDRPEGKAESLHAVTLMKNQPPEKRRQDFLKQLSGIMEDIDNTVGRRAA